MLHSVIKSGIYSMWIIFPNKNDVFGSLTFFKVSHDLNDTNLMLYRLYPVSHWSFVFYIIYYIL